MGIKKILSSIWKFIFIAYLVLLVIGMLIVGIPEILGKQWLVWLTILIAIFINFVNVVASTINRKKIDNLIKQYFPGYMNNKYVEENTLLHNVTEDIMHEIDNENKRKALFALLSNIIIIFILLFFYKR
jgi:hypothetical protein